MKKKITSYRDLEVWETSHELVLEIYKRTKDFPSEERFGLISQIRRAAISIPANIAEGKGRRTTTDYIRFLYISQGSLEELKYLIELSFDLKYIDKAIFDDIFKKTEHIGKQLSNLIQSLSNYIQEPEERYHNKTGVVSDKTVEDPDPKPYTLNPKPRK